MLPEELRAHLQAHSPPGVAVREDEARRLLGQALAAPALGAPLGRRRPVARRLHALLAATTEQHRLEVVERAEDPADGFVKYLLRSPDGALHEAVRIPLEKPGAFSVCLSTQVGCAMA